MRPWERVQNGRLGLKIAVQRAGPDWEGGGLALGWALIGRRQKVGLASEEATSDPIERLIEVYRRESAARSGCEGITLYRYGSKAMFALSDVASDGITHAQHNKLIDRAKAKLEEAGIPVAVEIVK